MNRLDALCARHRRLDRMIDTCRAPGRQEEMKLLKRLRLRLKDRISLLQRRGMAAG
ncbi:DUF465 domain-containing protein [Qipengyuania gaetbuli]|jgi:uncharacterized protein YdcH (DUF465 family)|uniref:DUF465 domain-containing protein n=1 Tax=Qipengyuania gaetbuli TaxID=266952 RepID=UPI001C9994F4|nr:DUF465 domain-containing protein [Qipengyuania gaetbuli]MBY6015643.1 DUF465 domain-containing protein [Qipengyuania gaetbuli]